MANQHYIEELSRAVSLTVLELDVGCERLIPAYLLANVMSPALWTWREQRQAHAPDGQLHSPNRRLRDLARHFYNYSFTRLLDSPGGDPWGLLNFSTEEDRLGQDYVQQVRSDYDRTLKSLLEENPDSQFGTIVKQDYYGAGYFPRLRNEIIDIMNAYASRSPDGKASGKCAALAMLWAAALVVWGRFSPENVVIIGNRAHVFVFLDEGKGHLFNNTKWFNKTRIQNGSTLSEFVKKVATDTETTFLYCPAIGMCQCTKRVSEVPEAHLAHLVTRLHRFLSAPIKIPEMAAFTFTPPSPLTMPSPETYRSSETYQAEILRLADENPGSIFDFARYSYRHIHVPHPEAYARAATRDYHTQQLATGIRTLDDALEIVRGIEGQHCAFGSRDRLALPDETLFFGTGDDRERALFLFSLLYHSPMHAPDIALAFAQDDSYVRNNGRWFSADGTLIDPFTGDISLRLFNTETNWLWEPNAVQ